MEEPPIALIMILSLVLGLAVTAGMLYYMRDKFALGTLWGMVRSKVVAQVDAAPTAPFAFTLRHVAQEGKLHRICLKMQLKTQTGGSDGVGITCAYKVTLGSTVVAEEVVGYGMRAPEPFDRRITRSYFYRATTIGSRATVKATIVLGEIERCPQGEEIVVEGSCQVPPGTEAGPLVATLRA